MSNTYKQLKKTPEYFANHTASGKCLFKYSVRFLGVFDYFPNNENQIENNRNCSTLVNIQKNYTRKIMQKKMTSQRTEQTIFSTRSNSDRILKKISFLVSGYAQNQKLDVDFKCTKIKSGYFSFASEKSTLIGFI